MNAMYPPLEPYHSGWLQVDDLHKIYFEESGNSEGVPVLVIHGGPGAGTEPKQRQYFDPTYYRIILVDQRGSGQSWPLGELQNNTTHHLIEDFEKIRHHLKIERWILFGGSWGATLAVVYAAAYPECVLGLILRGLFLGQREEWDWFFLQSRTIFPYFYEPFISYLPEAEREDPLMAYAKRVLGEDPRVAEEASRRLELYGKQCCTFLEDPEIVASWKNEEVNLTITRLAIHYFINRCFLPEGGVLNFAEEIRHLPIHIVQGKYDMLCPMVSTYAFHKRVPEARVTIVQDAGHSGFDPSLARALKEATDAFRNLNRKCE